MKKKITITITLAIISAIKATIKCTILPKNPSYILTSLNNSNSDLFTKITFS